jgi:deleted-in-malignant-brain-tumors protein 1
VRLVGGSNSSSGRVEVCANNVWGTICDEYWNDVDAVVVCRMLNFTGNAYAYQNAHFGQGSGSILLDNVQCIGTEYSVFSCVHDIIGTYNYYDCPHYKDASVVCLC